jgi:sigma-E factor negative regulatory protein RseB
MRYYLFLLLAVVATNVYAEEQDEAKTLLEQMRHSLQQRNFEGTFVYINGKDMETMHVVHEGGGKRGRSYVTALSGEAREVLRDSQFLTCITPDKHSVFREPIKADEFILPVPVKHADLHSYYQYKLGKVQRIAGLDCQQVRITPLDDYRFGYEYCLDQENGFPLRIATMDVDGNAIEQVMFTTIAFPEHIDQQVFAVQDKIKDYAVSEASMPKVYEGEIPFKIKLLPSGFEVKSIFYQPASADDNEFFQVILSDGLARASLFIAPGDSVSDNEPPQGLMRSGAVHAMTRKMDGSVLTIVGEVPNKTLQLILGSVEITGND